MKNFLIIVQLFCSTALIFLILLQAKGVGLGRTFGGGGEFYKSRRGVEKIIFKFTVILAFVFFVSSILNLLFY